MSVKKCCHRTEAAAERLQRCILQCYVTAEEQKYMVHVVDASEALKR